MTIILCHQICKEMKRIVSILLLTLALAVGVQAKAYKLSSPSGQIKLTVNAGHYLSWSLEAFGEKVLEDSRRVLGVAKFNPRASRRSADDTLMNLLPTKHRVIGGRYNELRLRYGKYYSVLFRVYDNGVAYRFESAFPEDIEVREEVSEWNFAADLKAYWANEKNPFQELPLSQIDRATYSYLPVSMSDGNGHLFVLAEVDLFDYPNMLLRAGEGNSLFGEHPKMIVRTAGSRTFPWRLLTIGDDRELPEEAG